MLFHVTLTHSEDNCPGYNRENMPETLAAFEGLPALAKELGVKQHSFVWTPTDHTAYALLEADELSLISKYIFSLPFKQHTRISPVDTIEATVKMAREISEED